MIKIKNTNEYTVNTSFVIDYYWNLVILASSEKEDYCLKIIKWKNEKNKV